MSVGAAQAVKKQRFCTASVLLHRLVKATKAVTMSKIITGGENTRLLRAQLKQKKLRDARSPQARVEAGLDAVIIREPS